MSKQSQSAPFLRSVIIGIVTGVVSSSLVALGAYYVLRENISMMVADGLAILNVQDTSAALDEIVSSTSDTLGALATPTTRPVDEILDRLAGELNDLKERIAKVKETEYYSVAELKQLAQEGLFSDDKTNIMKEWKTRPKREVTGLPSLRPQLARIEELVDSLERQLRQEPRLDFEALRSGLSRIQTLAASAKAALESRQKATLLTLEKFGKE